MMRETVLRTLANLAGGMTALALTLGFFLAYFRIADPAVFGLASLMLTAFLMIQLGDPGLGRTAALLLARHGADPAAGDDRPSPGDAAPRARARAPGSPAETGAAGGGERRMAASLVHEPPAPSGPPEASRADGAAGVAGAARTAGGVRTAVVSLGAAQLVVSLAIGAVLALAAGPLAAAGWLEAEGMDEAALAEGLLLIAAIFAVSAPRTFSTQCLNGLGRQATVNLVLVAGTLVRGIAGLVALGAAPDDATGFLALQLVTHAGETAVLFWLAARAVPRDAGEPAWPRPDMPVLRRHMAFAGGDGANQVCGALMLQGDRLVMSAFLTLEAFGAYSLISTLAFGLARLGSPFPTAFLPHFTRLRAEGRQDVLGRDYLAATQLAACVLLPAAGAAVAL
ncbi:MAG: hypothetical protein AAFR52_17985, partial [Pseudomonadota bacterium]